MTYNTVNIDLTSRSSTYNPIGPQGQWIYHRFGKRNFPEKDLPFSHIKKILDSLDKNQTIFFESFFGDALEYNKLIDVITYCNKKDLNPFVFTYGLNFDKSNIEELCKHNIRFYVKNYGINHNDKNIIENFDINKFKEFLKLTKSKTILEFHAYKHNLNDLPDVIDLCVSYNTELKISKGVTFDNNLSNVINSNGEWLYDIFALEYDLPNENEFLRSKSGLIDTKNKILKLLSETESKEAYRSVEGRRKLLKYLKNKPSKRNILNSKQILEINNFNLEVADYKDYKDIYVNYLGYVLPNRHFYEVFSNSLCFDWYDDYQDYVNTYTSDVTDFSYLYKDEYVHYLSGILKRLTEIDHKKINLKNNQLSNIEENFLDCFGYRYV